MPCLVVTFLLIGNKLNLKEQGCHIFNSEQRLF